MSYPIIAVEGIGPVYAEKLKGIGITTTEKYLEAAKDRKGRDKLSASLGIDHARVLKWANHCDLFRIRGIAGQMAELLEASGVDTVKELGHRVPAKLSQKMAEVNGVKKLCKVDPSEKVVAGWIAEAKTLAPVMTY
jgi:predicted flap endonuclease-1-like 5' DNA nuclease